MLRTYQPKKRHRIKGSWLQKENEYQERPQGFGEQKTQGQKKAVCFKSLKE